jgi:uracil-DNA glycosylase
MPIDIKYPRFRQWLDDLSNMPGSATSENLYSLETPEGRVRRANLEEYFRRMFLSTPRVIVVGEAPGYQGTRRTGVPFGSEHHISGASEVTFFEGQSGFRRAFDDLRIRKEPTSTVMWRTISQCRELPLLWAVYPLHPHQSGNVESNRTPTRSEVQSFKSHLVELIDILQIETVIALGNVAKTTLGELNIAVKVRHPSRGGASIFARQLYEILPPK